MTGDQYSLTTGTSDSLADVHGVAVSFNAIKPSTKNDKTYLTLNTTKDALKNAPGFKYDRQSTTRVPDNRASNDQRSRRNASNDKRSRR
jgi:hypothetical protein